MFRILIITTTSCFLLASCTSSPTQQDIGSKKKVIVNQQQTLTQEQKAQREKNIARNRQAVADAKITDVNGKKFRVAVIQDKGFTLVDSADSALFYNAQELETAAQKVTSCKTSFEPGILAHINSDIRKANLADLRTKISGEFLGWRVNLVC